MERIMSQIKKKTNRTLITHIVQGTGYKDNAKDLRDDLWEPFSNGDGFEVLDIPQEIHRIKQGERSVSEFYTDLNIL